MNINLYQIQQKRCCSLRNDSFWILLKIVLNTTAERFMFKTSIMRADLEKQMKAGVSNFNIKRNDAKGKVRYKVTKDYQKSKTYLNVRIGSDSYKVLEDRVLDWKILPEKEKIGNWEHKKQPQNLVAENGQLGFVKKFL